MTCSGLATLTKERFQGRDSAPYLASPSTRSDVHRDHESRERQPASNRYTWLHCLHAEE
jgi:hypothetical protein